MKVAIKKIVITDRIREDPGDIEALKKSIKKNGLLNPLTITTNFQLLAGFRRLTAAKQLGWQEIDCHFIDAKTKLEQLEIEVEENTTRKDFTNYELLRYAEKKEYITARGFKKFKLWLLKTLTQLLALIKRLINRT